MDIGLILAVALAAIVGISIIGTRTFVTRRNRKIFQTRIAQFVPVALPVSPVKLQAQAEDRKILPKWLEELLRNWIELAGWHTQPEEVILGAICICAVVIAAMLTFTSFGPTLAVIAALLLATVPFIVLIVQAQQTRTKLEMQLPNALDLMVSVLRSGHSVPQSIKAVANEMPMPCGREFGEILHRINLGQTLPDALSYSILRYKSFELDLLRRAFFIHADVGGSLAELLDKTNTTLRGRIKLKRHVQILTAPSKLTAIIVSLLPFVVAGGCFALAPDYLSPLLNTKIGNAFIVLGVVLQLVGMMFMRRLSTFKV